MDISAILSHVDHTLLKPEATWDQIKNLCDEAMEYGCATVCIPPAWVKPAADYVQGYLKICTVIGFPNGYNTTAAKLFETKDAVENGASEIDLVINNGMVRDIIKKKQLIHRSLQYPGDKGLQFGYRLARKLRDHIVYVQEILQRSIYNLRDKAA